MQVDVAVRGKVRDARNASLPRCGRAALCAALQFSRSGAWGLAWALVANGHRGGGEGHGRAAAHPYQRLPTDFVDTAEEGPFFGRGHEAGAHGIFADVLPFLRVALAVAEAVVQAAALKGARVGMGFGKAVFPKGHPFFDGEFQVAGRAEKVEVVRHEDAY